MRRVQQGLTGRAIVHLAVFAGALVIVAPAVRPATPPLSFRWSSGTNGASRARVEIVDVPLPALQQLRQSNWSGAQWQQLLSVYADQGDIITDVTLPAMLGAHRVQDDTIQFEPQFPWEPGIRYRAVFRPAFLPGASGATAETVASEFRIPAPASVPSALVSQIYPSGDEVPENLLKFYVHFSAPMSRGHIYRHIHLRNEAGQNVELPFLEIDEELWNPAMTRLTLIIDPGRIKRGVRPLEEIGPALETGKTFTLVIDREWPDSRGQPLKESFRKTFRVGPPNREPLNPAQWAIQSPASGTIAALMMRLPKPLDHALAHRLIHVIDPGGRVVQGTISLEDHERKWIFVPQVAWGPGPFQLVIHTTIEDLAGNNIGKSFEVDLFEKVDRQLTRSVVKLPFQVR